MPIRHSQKKRNAEPRQKQNHRRLVIDPMVNPGSSAHRHQARSKADPTRPHHRMVTLAQSSPGDRSARAPQSKTATVMLGAAVAQDTGSKSPTGPTILVPNPSSVAEPVSGGGPAPDVAGGPGYPRQPTIVSSAFTDYGWLPLKYASNAAKMVTFDAISPPLAWPAPPAGTVSVVLLMITT